MKHLYKELNFQNIKKCYRVTFLILLLVVFGSSAFGQATQLEPIGNTLAAVTNADDSYQYVDITSTFSGGIKIGSTIYTSMYVGSNGYVTFGVGNNGYSPLGIAGYSAGPIIAAQYDDINTGNGGDIYYSPNGTYLVVTYLAVAPFQTPTGVGSGGNTFQIVLRQGTGYNGTTNFDFQIEVRYINMNWAKSGNVSSYPTSGWSTGTQVYGEMPYSGLSTFLSNQTSSNIGVTGVYRWDVIDGTIQAVPTVNVTDVVTSITSDGGYSGGNINSNGTLSITTCGLCYSTSAGPTVSNGTVTSTVPSGTDQTGTFTAAMIGLNPSTTYYVRAFATNSLGTGYGPQQSFTTAVGCINPTSGGTISSNQTICSGSSPSGLTSSTLPSGYTGTLEYKWQSSTTSASSGFSDIATSNSASYSPGALTTTTWFKRLARVTCMSNWTGAAESNVLQITVNSLPNSPTEASNKYIYDGTSKTAAASVGTGETVDWYATATSVTTISAPSGTNVGTYSAYAEARNTTTGCISSDRTYTTLTINQATLTVTAEAKTKIYGDTNPALTFSYSGWKNSETETVLDTKPIASTTVTLTTSSGTYENAITLSGGNDNNYDFTYIPADFEVTKGILIVWLDPKTKEYGQDNPVLTYRYTGFMNGDDEADLDILHFPSTTVDKYTEPGVYVSAITMVGGLDNNYQIFDVPADFTVTKIRQQIVFDEIAARTYGDKEFAVLVSATSGLPVTLTSSNENVAVVSGNMVTIKGIGTTTITATQSGGDKVEATSKSNILSVNPKLLTIDGLSVKTKEYDGTAVAEFAGGTLSGVVYSDVIALNIPATGTFSQTTVGNNIPVSATVTVSGDKAGNYIFHTPEMKGNILPKVINVTAKDVTVECIQTAHELKYTYEPSLIGGDKFTGTLTRTVGDTPGAYPISVGTLTAGSNYSINFKPANYTILNQANRPPVVDVVVDQKTAKNSKQLVVTLTGIDPVSNCITQDIESIVASAENKTLVPEILVDYVKGQTTATLKMKIADNQAGETKITVKLKDNGGTDNGGIDTKEISFNLKVEIPTGVADIPAGIDVRIYPNPSSGPVTIDCIGFSDPSIRIFNIAGEGMLKKSNLGGTSQSINLSDFAPGVYFVEISEDGKVITKKLIIKK